MKVTIQLKRRINPVTGEWEDPSTVELDAVQEVNLNFERQMMTVRYAVELAGARSSNVGEYSLADVESYDWDEFAYTPVPNDAIMQFQARRRMERQAEENAEITREVTGAAQVRPGDEEEVNRPLTTSKEPVLQT